MVVSFKQIEHQGRTYSGEAFEPRARSPTVNAVLQCPTILTFWLCYCSKDYCGNNIQPRGSGYANKVRCYLSTPRMCIHVLRTLNLGTCTTLNPNPPKPTCKPEDPSGVRNWEVSSVIRHDNRHMSRGHGIKIVRSSKFCQQSYARDEAPKLDLSDTRLSYFPRR